MQPLSFGPLEHVALLGASSIFTALVKWGQEHGLRMTVLTTPDQAPRLEGLNPIVIENLTPDLRDIHLKRCMLGLSFGARWIMKQPIRDALFGDRIINFHGTRLPFDRGGGNWSYRVMRGDRLGCLLAHKVDDGIDTGPVVLVREYIIPRRLRTPDEIHQDYLERLLPFVQGMVQQGIGQPAVLELQPQPSHFGSYFPRLLTSEHAEIDWQMRPDELERFILAFDEPYTGAWSHLNGRRVSLLGCQLHGGEARVNDWQAGTIIRMGDGFAIIALRDGWSLIVESITGENGQPCEVRPGDRFLHSRVNIGPKGVNISGPRV